VYEAYLVELFPFAQRAKGITIFQLFGRSAGFFTTFVNPIGLNDIGWKWMITYCAWLGVEIAFIVRMPYLHLLLLLIFWNSTSCFPKPMDEL
jgi:hypothetical protein